MMRRTAHRWTAASAAAQMPWPRGDARPDKTALFPVGSTHNGFTVAEIVPIPDLRLTIFKFVHRVTGSVVHHLDSNDTNNAFCMGFGTPATSNRGTTHVLEHTVLCGSRRYPAKDPFFHMLRRSLSTFMNAMTGADYTLYPFATVNPTDFQNILSVYLDAVFDPLLRADDFRQEGHRLEPATAATSEGPKVAFNGVVFNEMRGVVSEPARHFVQQLQRAVLPGTHYAHLSGGDPHEVLDLTHDEVIAYHRRHYSPWNAVTLTYGDMDPRPAMSALDEYFTRISETSSLPPELRSRVAIPSLERRRQAPQSLEEQGPCAVMGEPSQQSKVIVSYPVGGDPGASKSPMDFATVVRLSVLDTLLTDGPASPMFKALISEGKLGHQFAPMTGFASHYATPLLSYGVAEVDRGAVTPQQVEAAVDGAVAEVIADGFDPRRVESAVFQAELSQRHRSASYGVNACVGLAAFNITLNAEPAEYLNWLPYLREIAQAPSVLQQELKARMATPAAAASRTTLTMHADKAFAAGLQQQIDAKLATANEKHTERCEKDPAFAEAFVRDHEAWLERVRAPQSADVLPTLSVRDIPQRAFEEPPLVRVHDGVDIITTDANGLVYVNVVVPLAPGQLQAYGIGSDALRRMPLMDSLAAGLGDRDADFEEFDVIQQLACGSIGFRTSTSQRAENPAEFVCGTTTGFYTTMERLPKALALLRRLFLSPRVAGWSQKERDMVSTAVCSRAADKADGIQRQGNAMAAMAAYGGRSFAAGLQGEWRGLQQATFLQQLSTALTSPDTADATVDALLQQRKEYIENVQLRANRYGADVWAVCDACSRNAVAIALRDFRRDITSNTTVVNDTPRMDNLNAAPAFFAASVGRRDVPLPINTSFVGHAIEHDLAATSPEHLALRIACCVVKSEFLHQQVRELGGAYGVSAESSFGGVMGGLCLTSYRDPNPTKTIEAFGKAAEWLASPANVTQRRVDEAKLSLFGRIDHPVTCDSYGSKHRMAYLTPECQARIRAGLLAVTPQDVMRVAPEYFSGPAAVRTAVLVPAGSSESADSSA